MTDDDTNRTANTYHLLRNRKRGGGLTLSIERVRELLGPDADGKTDEQLQHFTEQLDSASVTFYDHIQEAWKRDPDSVRWFVHAQQTGESE